MQYMIESLVDACLFQDHHVERLFHYTNGLLIAIGIATDRAGICLGNVETARTIADTLFHTQNCLSQPTSLVGWATQNEKGQALRRLDADPW